MPITEVPSSPPPNAEQTPDPNAGLPPRRNTSDYGDLGTDELVQRISELEDERRAARIREGIWVALLLHAIVVLVWIFGPHYIWHEPVVVTPKLKSSETLTYMPPRSTPHPAPVHPSIDSKTLQRLQAMRHAAPATPQAPTAPQTPAAPQKTAPQPAQQAQSQPPPPPQQLTPTPAPQEPRQQPQPQTPPQQQPQPQAAPSKNPFQTPSTAGDMIRQAARAASGGSSSGEYSAPRGAGGMGIPGPEILSDTLGYDFDPYLKRIVAATYAAWLPIIPESARPPLSNRGKVFIDFIIAPDGSVKHMILRGPSGAVELDRAAWGGITGAAYPPLPKDFKGPNLALRFGFYYNIPPEEGR